MLNKHIKILKPLLMLSFFSICGLCIWSCADDDDGGPQEIELSSFGPMPIERGAELKFIGVNLNEVNSIVLPSNLVINSADFTAQSEGSIKLIVPQEATEGFVELIAGEVTITTKTKIGYSEPIVLASFSPKIIKAGNLLTIDGDYLDLVKEVIFTDRVAVESTEFESQSRKQITLLVPVEAQTGKIAISNMAEEPIIVSSDSELTLITATLELVSPNPVKPGSDVTISGTDLDLVTSIVLGGDVEVTKFTLEEGSITFTVPRNSQDGIVILNLASGQTLASEAELIMEVPTVTVSPTVIKNGATLTVSGENLDLINEVVFAENKIGVIQDGRTETEIKVTVPENAISGEVVFNTTSAKSVLGGILTLIEPVITSFVPLSGKPNVDVDITGTDLDLVNKILFSGDVEGIIVAQSATQITVTIPVGAVTGPIKLIAINETEVFSTANLEVLQNLPTFTSYSETKGVPGEIITINGSNLSLIKELVFPEGLTATAYGEKTDTKVEVYVPENVVTGMGQIRVITYEGEEGFFPELYFGTTDPITDQTKLVSHFNGGGASQAAWSSVVTFGQPSVYLDGTDVMLGQVSSGWKWGWANNWDTRPTLDTPSNYVVKFDVCITKAAPGVNMMMRVNGTDVSFGQPLGITTNNEWITMSFDVLTADMTVDGTDVYGIIFNGGSYDLTGVMIDNLRFDPK